uniref:Uncharacterized protein n=1 Tax=Leishmania guyanensis TaxID=5670 RepID=A0A1E1IWY3_LEIGU|nr:Hypothetical protein BN36_2333180 [Leishmania guyanensis]
MRGRFRHLSAVPPLASLPPSPSPLPLPSLPPPSDWEKASRRLCLSRFFFIFVPRFVADATSSLLFSRTSGAAAALGRGLAVKGRFTDSWL